MLLKSPIYVSMACRRISCLTQRCQSASVSEELGNWHINLQIAPGFASWLGEGSTDELRP